MEHEEEIDDETAASLFLKELEDASELVQLEGELVGLCPNCLDTGYVYLEKEGYGGIQARKENETIQFNQCFHNSSIDDDTHLF